MKNNILKISKMESLCSGCAACLNVCPQKAISLVERNGYFLFPDVNISLCTDCGLCKKVCPALKKNSDKKTDINFPTAYAGYIKDGETRKNSTSGGAFSAIANYALNNRGIVCGAAFTHDTCVEHIFISNTEDLKKLHGSKYLQSNVGIAYQKIKELLNQGKIVLFIGTPCQVAALKAVLGKEYEKLITVDLFCHGVPPQKLFKQYVDEISNGKSDTASNIQFRNKQKEGWENFHISFDFDGGHYDVLGKNDVYFQAFRDGLTLRKSCTNCKFSTLPRQGDFTIGDFLSLAKTELNITDDKGVSTIIVNNEKAEKILNEIKNVFEVLEKIELGKINQTNLLTSHSYAHPNAERFKEALLKKPTNVKALMEEYLKKSDNIAILNWHNSHNNYGSVLTGYALKEKIKQKIGYSPIHIIDYIDGGAPDISDLIEFAREYIPETEPCWNDEYRKKLNKHFQTFIAGPDGIWRNMGFSPNFYMYLLDFADISKNICSYAPSLGLNRIVNTSIGDPTERIPTEEDLMKRKRLLKRFNHISVREDSGVSLLKDTFDVESEHVLDAVFLLKEEDYQKLIDTSELTLPKNYSVKYIINQSCVAKDIIQYIEKNQNMISLYDGKDHIDFIKKTDLDDWTYSGPKCVDWLKLMQGSNFVITDSFHGLCFAIIFKKQFVLTDVTFAGNERHKSLLRMLDIQDNRFASSLEEMKEILNQPIDYDKVYKNLQKWVAKSEAFLDKILADNKPDKTRNWIESIELKLAEKEEKIPEKQQMQTSVRFIGLPLYRSKIIGRTKRFKFFGIPVVKIKERSSKTKKVYILGIPLLKIKKENENEFSVRTLFGFPLVKFRYRRI